MYIMFARGVVIEYEDSKDYDQIRAAINKLKGTPRGDANFIHPEWKRAEVIRGKVKLIDI